MKTKNTFPIKAIVTGLLLIMLTVASIGFYASRPQSEVAANGNAKLLVDSARPVNSDTSQPPMSTVTKTVNAITFEIVSTKIIETGIEVGVCYTAPDGGDWYLTPGHLVYGANDINPDEFEFTTEQPADGKNNGKRCALVRYRIDDTKSITTPVRFSILDIYAIPREMFSACGNFQQRLNTSPKANADGLKARCEENSDGSISVALESHGKSTTNEKAKEVLDGIVNGVIPGPWEFVITASQ